MFLIAICFTSISVSGQWTALTSGLNSTFNSVNFVNDSVGFVAGYSSSPDGIILKTTNGGINWDTSFFDINKYFYSVFFTDNDTGYLNSSDQIFKTTDGGMNWITLNDTFSGSAKGLYFLNGSKI